MYCPIDRTPLHELTYEGCIINACRECGGELVSGDALAHIARTRLERFGPEFEALVEDSRPIAGTPSDEQARSLECPCCGQLMESINYAGDTAVFVDRCPDCCSVWLDKHELEMVQALLERWSDQASERLMSIAADVRRAQAQASYRCSDAPPSRFAFASAVLGKLFDAA